MPSILIYSSIASLVVPGTSVTIALFSLTRALRRDDLPTLGLPTITVLKPSLRIFPSSAVLSSISISLINELTS